MRVLPTKWRRTPAGIDMEWNYVNVTLCILSGAVVTAVDKSDWRSTGWRNKRWSTASLHKYFRNHGFVGIGPRERFQWWQKLYCLQYCDSVDIKYFCGVVRGDFNKRCSYLTILVLHFALRVDKVRVPEKRWANFPVKLEAKSCHWRKTYPGI